jgi:hypothetical protein
MKVEGHSRGDEASRAAKAAQAGSSGQARVRVSRIGAE